MGVLLFTWDSVPILNTNNQQPRRIINMMKVALVLLVATVLISRSAGNPVREARQGAFGNQQFNGGVGTVNQCATTGSCNTGSNGNANRPPQAVQGSNQFNSKCRSSPPMRNYRIMSRPRKKETLRHPPG